jgi:nucleotide-binding universal stress UspA family protein
VFLKDMVVFVEEEKGRNNRLAFAVELAEHWKVHLIVTFVANRLDLVPSRGFAIGNSLRSMLWEHAQEVRETEEKTRQFFEELVKGRQITSEWRFSENDIGESLMLHARHADLAIVGPPAHRTGPATALSLAEDIIFASGRPSLLLPIDWPRQRIPRHIVVGWNGSREATRAIAAAMPFLSAAESVHLIVVPEKKVRSLLGEEPGMDISRHLVRHGVPIVLDQCSGSDAGAVLVERMKSLDADLLVMGAYGRPKISEFIFGGVTHSMLDAADFPILLSQ